MKSKIRNRIKTLKGIAPEYPRIAHIDRFVSNMTHDDIVFEDDIKYPLSCWVQEKIDGANLGVSWTSGPVVRNRNNVLQKGYSAKETPSKLQFRPVWNWAHAHGEDIRRISEECYSQVTIYGEWMNFKHSLDYNKLPDIFIAYDIYSVEDRKYLAPDVVDQLLSKTNIKYIKPHKVVFNNRDEIVAYSERPSDYRDGRREGIVVKTSNGRFVGSVFKVVNKYFVRREDFNEVIIKNTFKK